MQCPTPTSIADPHKKHKSNRITVPCGKCGACRKTRRNEWAFRLSQELKTAKNAYFITLTYSDENLPFTPDGVITLDKKDLQNFQKRLRKLQKKQWPETKYRYYAVGEYGTETDRPHYHIIAFNVAPDCLRNLSTLWPFGIHHIGTVTTGSIFYVAKYHVNAVKADDDRVPEFATMSRRPGIGHNYVKKKWTGTGKMETFM